MNDLAKTRRKNTLRILAEKTMSKKTLAEGLNVHPSLISAYLGKNPKKSMGDNLAARICKVLGVTLQELDRDQEFVESIIRENIPILSDANVKNEEKYVLVPFFKSIKFSCKDGILNDENQEVRMIPCEAQSLSSRKILKKNAQVFLAEGDSMFPVFPHGAKIFLDKSRNCIQRDGVIYVIFMGGLIMVKYLFRLPNQGIRVVSANPNKDMYPDIILDKEEVESDRFNIVGQVFHIEYDLPI